MRRNKWERVTAFFWPLLAREIPNEIGAVVEVLEES